MRNWLYEAFTENWSYKLVALFVAMILWITVLGRRDILMTKSIEVDLLVGGNQRVVTQSTEHIKVQVMGPRQQLIKFLENQLSNVISLDLTDYKSGSHEVEINLSKLELPLGVSIVSVKPNKIKAVIVDVQ